MSTTPPGWYDDGSGTQRWWDGSTWTDHVQPQAADASPAPEQEEAPSAPTAAEVLAGLDPAAAAAAGIAPTGTTPETPAYPSHAPTGAPVAGYPGGYPGGPAYGAPAGYPGYAGQTPQSPGPSGQKSKLWIVFVVLGVLVIGLIVLAAVFIPRIIGTLVNAGDAAGGDAEQAAIVAVERYDEAWNEADCDLYFAATTEDYRAAIGMTDCAAFEAEAQIFGDSTDEYEITVDSVEREADVITVMTTETFLSLIDEDNQPLATPEAVSTPYEYTLVPAGDGWAIDDVW